MHLPKIIITPHARMSINEMIPGGFFYLAVKEVVDIDSKGSLYYENLYSKFLYTSKFLIYEGYEQGVQYDQYIYKPEFKKIFINFQLSVSNLHIKIYNSFGADITQFIFDCTGFLYDFRAPEKFVILNSNATPLISVAEEPVPQMYLQLNLEYNSDTTIPNYQYYDLSSAIQISQPKCFQGSWAYPFPKIQKRSTNPLSSNYENNSLEMISWSTKKWSVGTSPTQSFIHLYRSDIQDPLLETYIFTNFDVSAEFAAETAPTFFGDPFFIEILGVSGGSYGKFAVVCDGANKFIPIITTPPVEDVLKGQPIVSGQFVRYSDIYYSPIVDIKILESERFFGGVDLNNYKKKIEVRDSISWSILVENADIDEYLVKNNIANNPIFM